MIASGERFLHELLFQCNARKFDPYSGIPFLRCLFCFVTLFLHFNFLSPSQYDSPQFPADGGGDELCSVLFPAAVCVVFIGSVAAASVDADTVTPVFAGVD